MSYSFNLVAVDVSKNSLVVQTEQTSFTVANTREGICRMLRKIPSEGAFVVCEATGGYERLLMDICHEKEISICRANPSRIRAFACSEGIRAKTDPIDADMILRFAQEKELRPTLPPDPHRKRLAALLDRRNHLKEQAAREKNRIQNSPEEIHSSIERMLLVLKDEIAAIDNLIRETIDGSKAISSQVSCLKTIRGVGEVTAWTIVALLGEITHLSRNQLVALAGVAPFNRDSGMLKGQRRIIGGRAKVRAVLYMAATTAAVHNPVIKQYVNELRGRGKPYKCAIVAAMRKMLIHMQSELKRNELMLAR
jgi:transposase